MPNIFTKKIHNNFQKKLLLNLERRQQNLTSILVKSYQKNLQKESNKTIDNIIFYLNKKSDYKIKHIINMTKKLICQQLDISPELIIPMIEKILAQIGEYKALQIRICPDHVKIVKSKISKLTPAGFSLCDITILPDDSLKQGSIVIKAHKSIIDARVETRLAQARKILKTIGKIK